MGDVGAITLGLFLIIVANFEDGLIAAHHGGYVQNIWEICGNKKIQYKKRDIALFKTISFSCVFAKSPNRNNRLKQLRNRTGMILVHPIHQQW